MDKKEVVAMKNWVGIFVLFALVFLTACQEQGAGNAFFTNVKYGSSLAEAAPESPQVVYPHFFSGRVLLNGHAAPVGTQVQAVVGGQDVTCNGPYLVEVLGEYGNDQRGFPLVPERFAACGDASQMGQVVQFVVDGVPADQYETSLESGWVSELDLSLNTTTCINPLDYTGPAGDREPDGQIGVGDAVIFTQYYASGDWRADLDGDGFVTIIDKECASKYISWGVYECPLNCSIRIDSDYIDVVLITDDSGSSQAPCFNALPHEALAQSFKARLCAS